MIYDRFDHQDSLLKRRQILVGGAIDSNLANDVVLKLLYLIQQSSKQKITMIINSPGGSVHDGMAILDTMDYAKSENIIVETICIGKAASMGGIILAHGSYKNRKSLKNSMIMLHQPLINIGKDTSFTQRSLSIESNQMTLIRKKLEKSLSENTGEDIQKINSMLNDDCYITPEEALNFGTKGIIDKII